jgi:Predicted flavoprotein involved in K+ transport
MTSSFRLLLFLVLLPFPLIPSAPTLFSPHPSPFLVSILSLFYSNTSFKSNFLFLFQPVRRVAVIGAGVSGLCCARRFTEPHVRDKFELVIYEQTDRVGGTWVYTPQVGIDENTGLPVHSSMYENLRCV